VLLTRPAQRSGRLAELLAERGAVPVICPVLEMVQLVEDGGLRDAWKSWREQSGTGIVVLTSARTVEYLVSAGVQIDQDCAAVGPATLLAVQSAGWPCVDVEAGDAASLARELIRLGRARGRVWLPSSKRAGTTVEDALAGAVVTRIDIYEPRASADRLLEMTKAKRPFDVIVFHSPSAVDATVDTAGAEWLAGAGIVCVGPTTASQARRRGLEPAAVATHPTDEAVAAAVDAVASRSSIIGAI
jgi:uroporphyrinogen-III synthase